MEFPSYFFNQLYRLAKLPLRVFIFCTQSPRETELSKFACDLEDLLYRSLLTVALTATALLAEGSAVSNFQCIFDHKNVCCVLLFILPIFSCDVRRKLQRSSRQATSCRTRASILQTCRDVSDGPCRASIC